MTATASPNALPALESRLADGTITRRSVWGMLALRPGLALGFQCLFTLGYLLAGASDPWRAAADWWLGSFALGEFINLWLLVRLARREGLRYWDLLNPGRVEWKRDVRWLVLALVVSGPLAALPNPLLATALWGDVQVSADLTFRALPVAAAWATLVVFPIIHAFTELPTYYGYVMPRLQAIAGTRLWPALLCAFVLSIQHVFLPLLFDWRFVAWRAVMFLPFALWLAWVLNRRPTVLQYMVPVHWLLDLSLPVFVVLASIAAA